MESVGLFTWVTTNWASITAAVLSIIGAASVIVKLTPTPKDDAILAKIIAVLSLIGLNPK